MASLPRFVSFSEHCRIRHANDIDEDSGGKDNDSVGCLTLPDVPIVTKSSLKKSQLLPPSSVSMPKGLTLDHPSKLAELSRCLTHVSGDVILAGFAVLRALPKQLETIGGTLDLRDCLSLEALPAHLSVVDGSLLLRNCTSLASLPATLRKVQGDLDISGCTHLSQLPKALRRVDGALLASGCVHLRALPVALHVHGGVRIEHCRQLCSLPAALLRARPLQVTGLPLPAATMAWLGEDRPPPLRPSRDLTAAAAFWAREAGVQHLQAALDPEADDEDAQAVFTRFLDSLREAREAGVTQTRQAIARGVVELLELVLVPDAAQRNTRMQQVAFELEPNFEPLYAEEQFGSFLALGWALTVAQALAGQISLADQGRRVARLMALRENLGEYDLLAGLYVLSALHDALDLPVVRVTGVPPDARFPTSALHDLRERTLLDAEDLAEHCQKEWTLWRRLQIERRLEEALTHMRTDADGATGLSNDATLRAALSEWVVSGKLGQHVN